MNVGIYHLLCKRPTFLESLLLDVGSDGETMPQFLQKEKSYQNSKPHGQCAKIFKWKDFSNKAGIF